MIVFTPAFIAITFAQTSIAARVDRPPRDTLRDTVVSIAHDTVPVARITLDLGTGPTVSFAATMIDLSMTTAQSTPKTPPVATVQLRFLRAPDTLSAELASRIGTGHIATTDVMLPAHGKTPSIALKLYDVQVSSMRLVTNEDNVGLVQQRLDLLESIAQLSIDLQEAQRQLAVTESLDKRKLSSSLEVAHAHATTDALSSRLNVQRQHLALVEELLSRWTPVREELVLTANRMDMQAR